MNERIDNSSPALIVTEGDRILCEDCHREGFCEVDPVTHFYAEIGHGVCDSCGLEIKKANAAGQGREAYPAPACSPSDTDRLNWLQDNRCSVGHQSIYGDWIVQTDGQVVGNIGKGCTAREAIDRSMANKEITGAGASGAVIVETTKGGRHHLGVGPFHCPEGI